MKYRSHIGQDRWVSEVFKFKKGGYFLELGALDGVTASNSYWMESQLGWTGICVEPNPTYFPLLCSERKCITVNRALWSKSNITMRLHDAHGLSRLTTLDDEPSTAKLRKEITRGEVMVDSISLMDLLDRFDAPRLMEYMSMDIEGSELEVLESFDFDRYSFGLLSIEVNSDEKLRERLRLILSSKGYEFFTLWNDELFYSRSNLEELTGGSYEDPVHVVHRVIKSYVVSDIKGKPPLTKDFLLPRPWLRSFANGAEWRISAEQFHELTNVASFLDDKVVSRRKPFHVSAYCAYCLETSLMNVSWHHSGSACGEVWPAWTETFVCSGCGLNSRMRAVYDYVVNELRVSQVARVYMPERITIGFQRWSERFYNISGSEYLGCNTTPGSLVKVDGHDFDVRHEDFMSLSFGDNSLDLIVSQDVFEHIPEYKKAFSECYRVLDRAGSLVFSIPFFSALEKTIIRAEMQPGGDVRHIHEPEYHGNPVSGEGALCFQNFSWDILDEIRKAGFQEVMANMYWGPWFGYYGSPFFVFSAKKT